MAEKVESGFKKQNYAHVHRYGVCLTLRMDVSFIAASGFTFTRREGLSLASNTVQIKNT